MVLLLAYTVIMALTTAGICRLIRHSRCSRLAQTLLRQSLWLVAAGVSFLVVPKLELLSLYLIAPILGKELENFIEVKRRRERELRR